jgi:glycosyltransferase involved in cell wall biosynthesis
VTRLAYLVSRYPAVSHTFVLREIRALRALGFTIDTSSINATDRPPADLTAAEREEADQTFYVKDAGLLPILGAHVATLLTRPKGYLAGLGNALRRGWPDLRGLAWAMFYFVEAVAVGRWMRRRGQTHLHVHFANPASTVASITARVFDITYSLTVHGSPPFHDEPGTWFSETANRADFVCCISHYCRSQVMLRTEPQRWPRFVITPMGIDPDVFGASPPRATDGTFEVLCVGRLTPVKGHGVLLEAIAALVAENRNVRLRLVGDGPLRIELEARTAELGLAERVIFEGSVNQDRIRSLYAGADAVALASFTEGVPVVLMEAMATERPCVATRVAGIPDLIQDGVSGLLVPPSDAAALAAALARLADGPDFALSLGRAGRQRVLERYDLARNASRLVEVFATRIVRPDQGCRGSDTKPK